jgi:hypothetical protein
MSTGQQLNRLDRQLIQLQTRVRQERLKLLGSGGTPIAGDMKYHDFWKRIAGFGLQLKQMIPALRSVDNLLNLRARASWSLPRNDPKKVTPGGSPRMREQQSIESHRMRLKEVYGRAVDVESLLRDLYFEGQAPTSKDLIKRLNKLSRQLEKTISDYDTQTIAQTIRNDGPSFESPQDGGMPGVPLSLLVTLIVMYIIERQKRR